MWRFQHIGRQAAQGRFRRRLGESAAGAATFAVAAAYGAWVLQNNDGEDDERNATSVRGSGYWLQQQIISSSVSSCQAAFLPFAGESFLGQWHDTNHQGLKALEDNHRLERSYRVNWRQKPIGRGGYGNVFMGVNRHSGRPVAIKQIPKAFTKSNVFESEINAMKHVKEAGGHDSVCGFMESFEQGENFYVVMELIEGGELFDRIADKGACSEADAARLIRQVASALAFLHNIGIVHCDLKPENIMLSSLGKSDRNVQAKLIDFGCAQSTIAAQENEALATSASDQRLEQRKRMASGWTVSYTPPEVLRQYKKVGPENLDEIQPSFDMWSLGVILFVVLTARHPFDLECRATTAEMRQDIQNGAANKDSLIRNCCYAKHLSQEAVDLLEGLLEWNPKKRMTAKQLLQHPWVKGEVAATGD